MTLSGTSMATPAVSAAVSMLLQQDATLTQDQIKARLMKTAYKTFPTSSVATDPTDHQTTLHITTFSRWARAILISRLPL